MLLSPIWKSAIEIELPTNQSPVAQPERVASIDVLRGFALLGILVMNIQSFGLIDAKYTNPMAQGELTGTNYWCWFFAHVFFDLKFMTLFSALFGAGIVLMWQRAKAAQRKSTGLHYRRMFWLLLFGLAHAYLLWHGDILVFYAMCGMVMYWVCGLKPCWLFPIGIFLFSVGSLLMLLIGLSVPYAAEAELAEFRNLWRPSAEMIAENLAIYRGGWLEQMPHRSFQALGMETMLFGLVFFWRISGLMLIGMALFKLDFFSAKRSNMFYLIFAAVGFSIGFLIVLMGVWQNEAHDWTAEYSFFLGGQYNYWGSVLVSLGYGCVVMLSCKLGFLSWFQKSLAAVGRLALTNYLLHTIICTTIFYGHGFGWFGYVSREKMLLIVLAIWLFQLIGSPLWLNYFKFGPFEWLWRSLSYWKLQPMRVASK